MEVKTLEEQNKAHILAQISHDLRQPLQALSIYACALLEENLTPEQMDIAQKIENSATNLRNMLNNLLDISQLEAHGLKYSPHIIDIKQLLQKIANDYQTIAQCQNIKFYSNFHYGISYTDSICVERIVRNLLSNAFKYNNGKVIFGSRQYQNNIRIFVIDNGYGIADIEIDKIFNEFYQIRHAEKHRNNGTGLGLAICKKLAVLLNTKIEVHSIEGRGSCFSFCLKKHRN